MITVQAKRLNVGDPTLPPLVLQVTRLVDTYMVWIGTADGSQDIQNVENVVLNGNLCKDWACAMPPRVAGGPSTATSLFHSSSSDVALSIAQRLARRFKKQVFLSVDISTGFTSLGLGQQLVMEAEKGIVERLKELEEEE